MKPKTLCWEARAFFLILIGLTCTAAVHSQAWSGVIAPKRATDWINNQPGVVGGVPSASWTQCGSTISAGSSLATLNAAIAACAPSHFVLLGPGTFTFAGTVQMKSGVVVRGAGANTGSTLTQVNFTGGSGGCGAWGGFGVHWCFSDTAGLYYGSLAVAPGGTNAAAWTGGYAQNAFSITLQTVGSTGILNGQTIFLDQVNDNVTPAANGYYVCDSPSKNCRVNEEVSAPGRCSTGQGGTACTAIDRNQLEVHTVVAGCPTICTGAGPFTLTISPGLESPNWVTAKTPGAWWSTAGLPTMQMAGLENLSTDYSGDAGSDFGAVFTNATNCWISGIRSTDSVRNHVWLQESNHITVQNSYFFGTQNGSTQSYGVESFLGSDNLVVNNIFQQVTTPMMTGQAIGSAFVYNYAINDKPNETTTFLFLATYGNHDAGTMMDLWEGNVMSGWEADVFHGIGGLSTLYRNYLVGWEVAKSTNTVPVQAYAYDRFYNIVGNVLGCNWNSTSYPGNCGVPYPTAYGPTQLGSGANKVIYDFGASLNEGSNTVGPDSYVATSAMLWGNCDAFHGFTAGNCRFVSSEVPTALTDGYQNSLPGSHTLPVSFAYTSTPSWWPSGKAFPIAGPDVTGGNINGAGGLAYTNPAQDCANTLGIPADGTGSVVPYTPCVGTQPTPPPAQTILIVGPSTASVQTNKTIQFTANCSPSPCNSVNWSTSLGSVSNGLFLAPSTAGTGVVTATIGANSASYPVNVIATSTAPVVTSFSSTITVTNAFPVPSTQTCQCTFTLNAAGNGFSKSCAAPCK